MPTYEYTCEDCQERFSTVEPISEHGRRHPKCPECDSKHVIQRLVPFYAKTVKKS
jgi:putative FmdB family regulatory protein